MSDLLGAVLDAHGGLDAWREVTGLTAEIDTGGPFWGGHGWPDALADDVVTMDARVQHIEYSAFGPERWSTALDVAAGPPRRDQITLYDRAGVVVAGETDPRARFPTPTPDAPWTATQTAYFSGYAMWCYLSEPFLFATWPGVVAEEIEPWEERGETWRRLAVRFPDTIANHNADQVFYYDERLHQRRMDYHPDVTGRPVAHYTFDHREFGGFVFPTRREVHRRNPDDNTNYETVNITNRIHSITVHRGVSG